MNNSNAFTFIQYIEQRKLYQWQREYLNGLKNWMNAGNNVTAKQSLILKAIYSNVTGGGQHQQRQVIK